MTINLLHTSKMKMDLKALCVIKTVYKGIEYKDIWSRNSTRVYLHLYFLVQCYTSISIHRGEMCSGFLRTDRNTGWAASIGTTVASSG